MRKVLFICTANQCRSPMAMALFQLIVRDRQQETDWQIESAGIEAIDGYPASTGSQTVCRYYGIDLVDHRSRLVHRAMLEAFDLVLTMEAGHQIALQEEFPDLAGRIHMLSEMAGEYRDVDDPIGKPLREYENTAGLILDYLERGFPRMMDLTDPNSDERS